MPFSMVKVKTNLHYVSYLVISTLNKSTVLSTLSNEGGI